MIQLLNYAPYHQTPFLLLHNNSQSKTFPNKGIAHEYENEPLTLLWWKIAPTILGIVTLVQEFSHLSSKG